MGCVESTRRVCRANAGYEPLRLTAYTVETREPFQHVVAYNPSTGHTIDLLPELFSPTA